MNAQMFNNHWGLEFDNQRFITLIYLPFLFIAIYFTKIVAISFWSILTPGSEWSEISYLLFASIGFGYIFYIGNWLLDAMEKGLIRIQDERRELLNKISSLEYENAEMRSIFKRAIQFTENDKQIFN